MTIHVPSDELGRDGEPDDAPDGAEGPSTNGAAPAAGGPAKKRTRRGSRGGKNRRKRTAALAGANGSEAADPGAPEGNGPAVEAPAELEGPPELEAEALVDAPVAEEPAPVAAERPEADGPGGEPEPSDDDWGYVPMSEWGDNFER